MNRVLNVAFHGWEWREMAHMRGGLQRIFLIPLQNPDITDEALFKKVVNRKSLKNGIVGASVVLGGVMALPLLAPACLLVTLKIQMKTLQHQEMRVFK